MMCPATSLVVFPRPPRSIAWLLLVATVQLVAVALSVLSRYPPSYVHSDGRGRDALRSALRNATEDAPRPLLRVSPDWFDEEAWNKHEERYNCFRVENICHSTHRFFYDPGGRSDAGEGVGGGKVPSPRQPPWELVHDPSEYSNPGYPLSMHASVDNETKTETKEMPSPCSGPLHYSPIANHMVLHGTFGYMLGEFYSRVLPGLRGIAGDNGGNTAEWRAATQLYLEIWEKPTTTANAPSIARINLLAGHRSQSSSHRPFDRPRFPRHDLLDSHRLFLQPFSSSPVLPFRELMDTIPCVCMKRLFFCGYDKEVGKNGVVTLVPGGFVNKHREIDRPPDWKSLRQDLRAAVIGKNGLMQEQILQFRNHAIASAYGDKSPALNGIDDTWLLIGLAQRSRRRKWLNLDKVLARCNGVFARRKILCVEINVEVEESNPVAQAVMHGGLDMLVGIHGAQLTEAIWMEDRSVVFELLPYIPEGVSHGQWTRTVEKETPVGVIFSGTDLNHVGYRLGRDSAPYCEFLLRQTGDPLDCWNENKNEWSRRDFVVEPGMVEKAIETFLLERRGKDDCSSMQNRSRDFALYNVLCSTAETNEVTVNHFYNQHWGDMDKTERKRGS